MDKSVYEKVLIRILEVKEALEEFSGAGAVGGVAGPLGAGPAGKVVYKSQNANDKKYRKKKRKTVQDYLKGTLKESRYIQLFEGKKTPRLDSLSRQEIIDLIDHIITDKKSEQISFSEKISGQHITIGVEGTGGKNNVYAATKESLTQTPNIFSKRFFKSKGSSFEVKKSFILKYPKLPIGEKKVFEIEVIKKDYRKPDYIAYAVPQTTAAVYKGDMTPEEAKKMSSQYVKFLSPADIVKTPLGRSQLGDQIIIKLEDLKTQITNFPERGFKKFVMSVVEPTLSSLISKVFGGSVLNNQSPIEGLAINYGDRFLKLPSAQFANLQRIQSSLYNEFMRSREDDYMSKPELFEDFYDIRGNYVRANMLYDFVNAIDHDTMKQSFGYKLFIFIKTLPAIDLVRNLRIFFSPTSFNSFCKDLYDAIETQNPRDYYNVINKLDSSVSSNRGSFTWYITSGGEDYNNEYVSKILEKINV